MRDQGIRLPRHRKQLRVREDERHTQALLVGIEVLLPHSAVRQTEFSVVSGPNHHRLLGQTQRVKGVHHINQVTVDQLHQIPVEVDVVQLLLLRFEHPEPSGDFQEILLCGRLRRHVLVDGRGQADVAFQPGVVIAAGNVGVRVEKDVVRVDQ